MYHFVSGYTAKLAGTEHGVKDPVATFSPCFGGAFLARHPFVYARLLAERMRQHETRAWLVSTGWTGGVFGSGHRIDLAHTRTILDRIHSGDLDDVPVRRDRRFRLDRITSCPGIPASLLDPRTTWPDPDGYDLKAAELAKLFDANFEQFGADAPSETDRDVIRLCTEARS